MEREKKKKKQQNKSLGVYALSWGRSLNGMFSQLARTEISRSSCVRISDGPITGRSASSSTLDENRAYASQVMRTKTPADALVS